MTVKNKKCKKCNKLIESIIAEEKKILNENISNKEIIFICPHCKEENKLLILNESSFISK